MNELIINLAPTGMVPMKADTPHVPVTAGEIAEDCHRCREAGASILHLHARDEDGKPTWKPDIYRRIIAAVKNRCPDAIICVSTSGRNFGAFEQRSAVLELGGDEKPEMASLTLGSLNFPKQASVNEPSMICALAQKMQDNGIVPELEVFDLGMIDYAHFLIQKGILKPPFYFNILLGSLGMLRHAVPPGDVRDVPPAGRYLGRCGDRPISIRGEFPGHRLRRARSCWNRGQSLQGCVQTRSHDQLPDGPASGQSCPCLRACRGRSGPGTENHRDSVEGVQAAVTS